MDTKPTKQQRELARRWPYLRKWDHLVVVWEIVKLFIRYWLHLLGAALLGIPLCWAEQQLRRIRP